jgi:hypothetical protein
VVQAIEEKLHANEVKAISNSVARAMVEYVMHRPQRPQGASPWRFLDFDVPVSVSLDELWEGVQNKSVRISSPAASTDFLTSWIEAHYAERALDWQGDTDVQHSGNITRFVIGPLGGSSANRQRTP